MDTVWTTVKVRRTVLGEACELMPGLSNAAVVQRALEQATGDSPESQNGPSRLTGAPSSARASNTPASSGGGPSPDVIPGESARGAGVDLPEVKTSGAALANDVVGASRVDPAPLDDRFDDVGADHEPENQTDIYEMLAGCPECAGRIEKIGDEPERCVDCGFTREP